MTDPDQAIVERVRKLAVITRESLILLSQITVVLSLPANQTSLENDAGRKSLFSLSKGWNNRFEDLMNKYKDLCK